LPNISISLSNELLTAFEKLRGSTPKSEYIAKLIEEKAKRNGLQTKKPEVVPSYLDTVKEVAYKFEEENGRAPTITELTSMTKLPYPKVWNAVKVLGIETLSKAKYAQAKRKQAEEHEEEQLESEALPTLIRWLNLPDDMQLYTVTHSKPEGGNSEIRIERTNLQIPLSRRYGDTEDALVEARQKVHAIVSKYRKEEFT
jgi:hypothetical protein